MKIRKAEISDTERNSKIIGDPDKCALLNVEQQETELSGVPALLVFKNHAEAAAKKGTILLFHGLGGSKETHFRELVSLAQQGFLAVGVDNVGHGKRRYADFVGRFSSKTPTVETEFLRAVLETAREVPAVIDNLSKKSLIYEGRVGAAGVSMGGYITFRAIIEAPTIKAAVSIVGSPEWRSEWMESPHRHIEKFSAVKLLSQTATKDEIVPAAGAREFHKALKRHYTDYDKRFSYIEFTESGHVLEESDWNSAWVNTLVWFESHLK